MNKPYSLGALTLSILLLGSLCSANAQSFDALVEQNACESGNAISPARVISASGATCCSKDSAAEIRKCFSRQRKNLNVSSFMYPSDWLLEVTTGLNKLRDSLCATEMRAESDLQVCSSGDNLYVSDLTTRIGLQACSLNGQFERRQELKRNKRKLRKVRRLLGRQFFSKARRRLAMLKRVDTCGGGRQ